MIHEGIVPLITIFIKLMVEDGRIPVRILSPDNVRQSLPFCVGVRAKGHVGQPILDMDWVHITIWSFDTLESTRYSTRLLINLKSEFLELDI